MASGRRVEEVRRADRLMQLGQGNKVGELLQRRPGRRIVSRRPHLRTGVGLSAQLALGVTALGVGRA